MSKTLDFLVSVVDNYGDAGFALDLAESILFSRPDWKIRFFSDNRGVFNQLTDRRPHANVEYSELPKYETVPPSETVVSFFDRKLPETHFVRFPFPKKILQISCLRFDPGVASMNGTRYRIGNDEVVHLVPSPIEGGAGVVVAPPGGRFGIFQESSEARWHSEKFGILPPGGAMVSVFCYPETLSKIEAIEKYSNVPFGFFGKNLPFFRFDEYADMLGKFDANIVRGENSAVKAIIAGKPFLWDFYKEKNGAHIEKIGDFLVFMRPFFETPADFKTYADATRRFNDVPDFTETDARKCAEILESPMENFYGAFERMAKLVRKRNIAETVLTELDA